MGEGPLVSVVIPTWNRRQLVREAVASVLGQTSGDFELILVDDGSTDGTLQELRAIKDPRVRLIAAEHAGSAAISRNRGVAEAKGEWIGFLDSDDLWMSDKLELQLDAVAGSGAGWCYGDYTLIDEHGADIPLRAGGFRPLSGWIVEDLLLGRTAVSLDCLLVRRDLLDKIGGFDPALRKREDLDFDLRLALTAEAVAVPRVLARVRDHPARKTAAGFAHEDTARVYRNFTRRGPEPRLKRIARKMLARHLADAAADRLSAGYFVHGTRLLAEALSCGDAPSHLLRAIARGARRRLAR